jgi:hypothetical protein
MQTATETSPTFEKAELFAEDARVHCVVLKIRTEPCVANLHPEVRDDRPFEEVPRSGCFLRTQQRAHPDGGSVRSFGCPASGLPTGRAIRADLDE